MKAILRHAMMMNLFSDMCSKVCKDTKKSEEFMKQIEIVFEKKMECEQMADKQFAIVVYKDPTIAEVVSVDKEHKLVRSAGKSSMKNIQEGERQRRNTNSNRKNSRPARSQQRRRKRILQRRSVVYRSCIIDF